MKHIFLVVLVQLSMYSFALGDSKMTPQQYIDAFKDEAIKEMKRTGIPASITLSQGMLESSYGNSDLARKANNHFGIKCHSDWQGARVYKDDDAKNECFRKYRHVLDSYRDHSDFLVNRSRYAFLFELSPADYKGWAKGLKKAGYATNPKYPTLLIDLIERYQLNLYDSDKGKNDRNRDGKKNNRSDREQDLDLEIKIESRVLVSDNFVKYLVVKQGDTFESIEKETGIRASRLLKYNERTKETLILGEKIYLQPKKKRSRTKYYTVKEGDNLYNISQNFAVKMKAIIKRNRLSTGESIKVGQQLKLRGRRIKL